MKRTLLIVAAAVVLVLTGCAEMGLDGSILERIEDIENRLDEVETLVNADKNGLVITSVQEVAEGYLIIFSDGSSVTVKHGKDGADGKDGQDGEDGKGGQDGENGSAGENGSNGSCIITSVEIGADSVTFNLSDGRTVVIPLQEGAVTPNAPSLTISFDYSHIDVVMPGKEYIIPYTVESNYDDITVEAFSGNSYLLIVSAIPDAEDNKKGMIHFVSEGMGGGYDMPSELEQELLLNSKITVLATDGKSVVMRTLKFENGAIGTYDASDIIVSGEGEVVQLNFLTNVEYTVEFKDAEWSGPADWLSLVETKALEEKTINVKVEKNDTGRCRRAYVKIYSQPYDTMWGDDERIGFSYEIYQNGTGEIEVNEITWTVGYEGGYFYGYELPFELVSYGNYMYCEESCSWIDYYFYHYDGFEYISLDYNDTIEERTATITIQEELYEYVYVYNEEYDYGYVVEQGNYKTTNVINVVQRPYGYVVDASVIYYTSTDGNIVEPNDVTAFDANIVSNTYENGVGMITFDSELTTIGNYAFIGCSTLAEITIPESVTTIGNWAFCYCAFETFTIPESVLNIGNGIVTSCPYLQKIESVFATEDGRCLVVDGVLNSFASAGLTTYDIPYGITQIGNYAFEQSPTLESVTIPNSVTVIGGYAFQSCPTLESVTIPDSVTVIGGYAFSYCYALENIDIPESVTEIYPFAFASSGLTLIDLPDNLTYLGNNAFAASALYDIDIPRGITTIPDELFFNCNNLTSVTIPSHVTGLGAGVFAACNGLTSFSGNFASEDGLFLVEDGVAKAYAGGYVGEFTFPSDVEVIGNGTFYGMDLKWISLSASNIHTIEDYAFGYTSLAYADISNVKNIGQVAFIGCYYLPEITIPSSVEYIGYGAFANCESLASVYCTGVTPAGVSVDDYGEWLGFYNTPNLTAIYVPKSDVTTYKSALGWSEYADIIYDISFAPVSAPAKSSAMASGISAGMAGGKKVCDDRVTSINPEARAQHTKGHRMGKDLLVKNFQR
ncbi:MAG: leucine-rich repeat protein [Tidjanibacter sp.]|nr:leucine-rich repeat protein [Tidjanibacter sp.]